MKFLYYCLLTVVSLFFMGAVAGVLVIVLAVGYFSQDLPDYSQLKDYEPPIVTRVYSGDGQLMEEYASEKRIFVPIEAIPDIVKNAFISAEDQNFYSHMGVDFFAIARAMVFNVQNLGTGRRPIGASTITQQVAKNFLLTNEVSIKRKIREAILAFRMERVLDKERLLELYLNEIYLGSRSYGVAAAALGYFNKSLDDLKIEEAAYLAALPKAPNNYHPVKDHDAALERRNWVLERMFEDGHLTNTQLQEAKSKPLEMIEGEEDKIYAPYFAEEVRRTLIEQYGEEGLYKWGGFAVRSSLSTKLQKIAQESLRRGLMDYDMRHGYRGAVTTIEEIERMPALLNEMKPIPGMLEEWEMAAVNNVSSDHIEIILKNGIEGRVDVSDMKWALGSSGNPKNVFDKGDVILVESIERENENGNNLKSFELRQIPEVQGAIIAIDPHTGRILAVQGGWKYELSEFNRATQAWRQPGSAFKPFVYAAALDYGFTPATLVLDAPFVIEQRPGVKWSPENYSGEYYGPTPLRVGVEKSKNLMTVRLADYIGMEAIIDYSKRFDVVRNMSPYLSGALGASETTLIRLTSGYAQFVNGGKKVSPTFIDRIQDRRGKTVFSYDNRECKDCGPLIDWANQDVPDIEDNRQQIIDPRIAYQIVSMLEGVVQRGTGIRIKSLGIPLAGKTGTTNESKDAWFIGFSPDLAVGVFVGFDEPKTLGRRETGSSVAVPIFKEFMQEALTDVPPKPFRVPSGVRHVRINAEDGTRAEQGDEKVIWEAFIIGTEPTDKVYILDTNGISEMSSTEGIGGKDTMTGTGGIY